MNKTVLDFSFEELENWVIENRMPKFRAKQIWQGFYKNYYQLASQFSTLPKKLIGELEKNSPSFPVQLSKMLSSKDGYTQKALFELADGKKIETVLMEYEKRNTICVSTQAGCALDCSFCATGAMGFFRNLTVGEITGQVLYFANFLSKKEKRVTNIVFMGMGESFLNYDITMKAIRILNDSTGFNIGARKMTVSTAGVVPGIDKFANEGLQVNLAISLHSIDDEQRSDMMPINKKYCIDEVMHAVRNYVDKTNRRVSFEWALIDGVNDSYEDAVGLATLLKGLLCHVNLIRLNSTPTYEGKGSERANEFKETLVAHHIPCSIRLRRGVDISAGCGQLASKN